VLVEVRDARVGRSQINTDGVSLQHVSRSFEAV
jgi:hypothetical protein